MLELAIIPVLTGAAALYLGMKNIDKDEKTIQKVFKNLKIGAYEKNEFSYPKLIATEKKPDRTRYVYRVPLGLTKKVIEPIQEVLKVTVDRPVEVTFKKWLYIEIFHNEMPKKVAYSSAPHEKGWVIPLGLNEKGWHFHDFDKTPHCTISGTTRFGKTVMLKNIMTYLIEHHPDDIEFIVLDMKGGLEFGRYKNLKQVVDVASNPVEAFHALGRVKVFMEQQEALFKANGWSNVVNTSIQKRLFVIVDEGAQLAPDRFMTKEQKDMLASCQHTLGEIARIGGALGIRLIFCTQYPTSDTLPRQVKQNADLKITFRLPTGYASQVAIDDYGAEELPSDIPGRAIVKTHEKILVQAPFISDDEMMKRLEVYRVEKIERREVDRKTLEDTVHFE
ncbi:FtsK/SpoIIIE domain-containing protein [Anoxybacillus flavithermus]|uniref:FtsK/SpoIIIE family protein (ATPase) n=1 Tax=Anoxybacillus flavithermus (strain DSM 21510 / WK1) TaxID=491915 RepID=B7GIQ0_ANOFW|nr:FtsK/SpoIIIE domain-containing protein [Anoxybacillus flavithermus]ACJ33065.1 FtsK/SpoIIIE family protein (ATPase) [Anoxybacillus flavithermus WK1]